MPADLLYIKVQVCFCLQTSSLASTDCCICFPSKITSRESINIFQSVVRSNKKGSLEQSLLSVDVTLKDVILCICAIVSSALRAPSKYCVLSIGREIASRSKNNHSSSTRRTIVSLRTRVSIFSRNTRSCGTKESLVTNVWELSCVCCIRRTIEPLWTKLSCLHSCSSCTYLSVGACDC